VADSPTAVFSVDPGIPHSVLRRYDDFGIEALDLVAPPSRFWGDGAPPMRPVYMALDARRAKPISSPATLLRQLPDGDNWNAMTRRSLARLHAWFLVCEDPERRLEAREVVTLAHQASLVRHVLQESALARVLIADEVGLGKTIEAGLILKELIARQPGLRVLYLAPARLVSNVHREFRRLGLELRQFVSGQENTATLSDQRIIASIHRAVHPAHFERFKDAPAWDVIVVDECHHLSDWAKGGGSPVRKYKLVESLQSRLRPGGRLILMSGTPHQGHPARFENLVGLLKTDSEPESALAGRVIYRTKEDVRDWEDRPLFPGRRVNTPIVVDLGPEHRAWLGRIHAFFEPERAGRAGSGAGRAVGWRAGQALQWATSSVEAGLGYLVRQGLRLGWDLSQRGLRDALEALRPYRGGRRDEAPSQLLVRMRREIQQQEVSGDLADIEEAEENPTPKWRPDPRKLSSLLIEGVALRSGLAATKWEALWSQVIAKAGDEKFVLFAQPIETVMALVGFLETKVGARPAVIVGGQSDEDRDRQIKAFWDPAGPRFLVSSRAGGEGLNLQVARRLVHLDVPWNPMEMEQRVGRVHRFLSRKTIIVDTMVVKESREADAYRIAREKLHEVASTLVAPERFEALFSRIMSLVAPDDLQEILVEKPHGKLDDEEQGRLALLVREGFERWRQFDQRFAERQKSLRALDPGLASWRDVRDFVTTYLRAEVVDGFGALRFRTQDGEVQEAPESVDVIRYRNAAYICDDNGGMPVQGVDGSSATPMGLNTDWMSAALREKALPTRATGAFSLRWPRGAAFPVEGLTLPFGVLALVRQAVQRREGGVEEGPADLRVWIVRLDQDAEEVSGASKGALIRTLLLGRTPQPSSLIESWTERLAAVESELIGQLARPDEKERADRMAFGVMPLLCGLVVGSGPGESTPPRDDENVDMAEAEAIVSEEETPREATAMDRPVERSVGDPAILRAISIRQPYVEQILRGLKTIEYRSKPTRIRERVYLYASLTPGGDAEDWRSVEASPGGLPVGVIVGSVEIVDCRGEDGDYEYDLERPVRLGTPLQAKNQPQPTFWRPIF